ncbi:MAG TPA: hypothetical protein VJ995_01975 [Geothermobacteraceae bacterium]|nr:hypothetical protein [Geothermobacteraceae bacterium]
MKKLVMLAGMVIMAAAYLAGCIAPQTWPDYKRTAESKIVVIQEKIGDGLKTGSLSADQSQMYLTTLKGIRNDDLTLRDKPVAQDEWVDLHARLDALNAEIDRAKIRPATVESSRSGDRILLLQSRIDDGRTARRWSVRDERDFQYRLDVIRQDYLRMTENGRYATAEERNDIDRRLDSLESDVNRSS